MVPVTSVVICILVTMISHTTMISYHSLHGSAELATRLVNGKPRYLDPQRSKTPELIDIKPDCGDYVGDLTPHANFGISTLTGGAAAYA